MNLINPAIERDMLNSILWIGHTRAEALCSKRYTFTATYPYLTKKLQSD